MTVAEASALPALNAALNLTAAVFLTVGYVAVRSGRIRLHGACMALATVVSAAFLVSYLNYHFVVVPQVGHTRFQGEGALRWAYFALLASHVVLAAANVPLVAWVLVRAVRRNWEGHRRLARWAWPVWMYVSVTGVLVYLALYQFDP